MKKYLDNFHEWLQFQNFEYFDNVDKSFNGPSHRLLANGVWIYFHLIFANEFNMTIDGGNSDTIPQYNEPSLPLLKNDDFLSMGIEWCLENGVDPHTIPVVVVGDDIYWAYLADLKKKILVGHNNEELGRLRTAGRTKILYPLSDFKKIDDLPLISTKMYTRDYIESYLGI